MKAKYLVPLLIFLGLAGVLGYGLTLNPSLLPSPLIDKDVPEFRLAKLEEPEESFSTEDMRGEVWLLNVWASWCVVCRQEHPMLIELARRTDLPIVGFNYKDERDAALRYLDDYGNPYVTNIVDPDGRVGIDLGVYGTPETFLIDREGKIRYKHVGPLTGQVVREKLLPKISELSSAG
jgi:cytochrome c biogenesis protein CcmG, thiol:disulfide interchange protein DsbE